MRTPTALHLLMIVATMACVCPARAPGQAAGAGAKATSAEAALKDCDLEKSLRLWREVLAADPDHKRARFVVARLTVQALDLDSHLEVIQTLIDKGVTKGTDVLLDAAARRAAADAQKARILLLRGRLACRLSMQARARASFLSAVKLYGDTEWGARSAIALAEGTWTPPVPGEAERLLSGVADNAKLPPAVREEARLKRLLFESAGWTSQRRIAALRALLGRTADAGVKRQVLENIIHVTVQSQGRWVPEAVAAAGAVLAGAPPYEQARHVLSLLAAVAADSQDPPTLDRLLAELARLKLKDPSLAREAALVRIEALISRTAIETALPAVKRLLADTRRALDALAAAGPPPSDRRRIEALRGRAYLAEAQKLIALAGTTEALPAVTRAKDHYLTALPADPAGSLSRLAKIGTLLEHVGEWEVAAALYREVADRFAYLPQGRVALGRLARLYERQLKAPVTALEVYAEYAARYPAELPYRQLRIGQRLRRLGYANVLDFQKRTGLKPDGLAGPKTRKKLAELEAAFDVIGVGRGAGAAPGMPEPPITPEPIRPGPARPAGKSRRAEVLRGEFVHREIFRIAGGLAQAGRHHDAIGAYLMVLELFPTKKEADDALLAVARLFRDNMLFEEALGAYAELMEYFPKGNVTSEAYVESASCLENLGRWDKARDLYKLYVKKFPKYKHVGLCAERIALLDEIQQYQDFLAGNPQSPKAPEAQYQIATLLYKKLSNPTKAAVEFADVAARYPKHVRAADGLFTAGAAHLRCENFPAARKVLADLVARYPASRLADDAQYWIGHTYEYSARAVGRLDKRRIVLRNRGSRQRTSLLADLALRRRYYPQARPGPELPEDVWSPDALGVLTSGSKRDRVNADLFRAIAAYRKVVDRFKMGDMAGKALHRIGVIHTEYLKDPEKGFQAYQELLASYPGTPVAVDALYQVGAYYLERKQFDQAVKSYRQFVFNYPTDRRAQDAMLAVARCHMEQKAWDKALDAYQSYLSKFPAGRHADFAKAQINWIRTYHY